MLAAMLTAVKSREDGPGDVAEQALGDGVGQALVAAEQSRQLARAAARTDTGR